MIKVTMWYFIYLLKMDFIENQMMYCWWGCGETGTWKTVWSYRKYVRFPKCKAQRFCNLFVGIYPVKHYLETRRGRSYPWGYWKPNRKEDFPGKDPANESLDSCWLQLSLGFMVFSSRKMVSFSCVNSTTVNSCYGPHTTLADPTIHFAEKHSACFQVSNPELLTHISQIADSLHHNSQRHKSKTNYVVTVYYYLM